MRFFFFLMFYEIIEIYGYTKQTVEIAVSFILSVFLVIAFLLYLSKDKYI